MDSNLLKTKSIEQLVGDAEHGGKALKRTLSALDLTLLGIGAIIGTGIFVLTGTAAANQAGPGHRAVVRARRAGLRVRGALLRGVRVDDPDRRQRLYLRVCDARRDLRLDDWLGPDSRYAVGSMTVADRLERLLAEHPRRLRHASAGVDVGRAADAARHGTAHQPPGRAHRAAIMVLLVVGVRESARFNAAMVAIKLVAVVFFIVVGRQLREPAELAAVRAVWLVGHHDRRRGRLLRLHRLRRRLDDGRGSEEPAARPADRHHRVAGDLHAAVSDSVCRHRLERHRVRSCQVPMDRRAVPECPGRLRALGDSTRIGPPVSSPPARSPASPACCSSCS